MTPRRSITGWIKRQVRGLGSLAAAAAIVSAVLMFAMFSMAVPDDGRVGGLASTGTAADSVEAAVEAVQTQVPSLYIKAMADRPITLNAEIEVLGWKNRGQRIIDTEIGRIESPVAEVRAASSAAAFPEGQISEQLSGQRVLASVSEQAAQRLPASGHARVALVVTPDGDTATLVIDEVIDPVPADIPQQGATALRDGDPAAIRSSSIPVTGAAVAKTRVTALSRYWGPANTRVTMTGVGFGRARGTSWVTCAGAKARILSWSDTSIAFRVPSGMKKSGYVGVVRNKKVSNGLYFSPFSNPVVTSITPREGAPGTSVTFSGTGFGSRQGGGWVTFSGSTAQVTSWSNTAIKVIVPRDATSGYAGVVANGMTSNGVLYGPLGAPLVASVSARVLLPDRKVAIRGRNFGNRPGTVVVGGARLVPDSWSPTEVRFTVARRLSSGYVGVIRADSWTSNGVWVPWAPRLVSVTSQEAKWWVRPDATLTLKGVEFGSTQGTRRAFIGGAEMTVKSWSDDTVVVVVPAGAAGYVGVGTSSACSNGIYVLARPDITSVSPSAIAEGDLVTVTGAGFGPQKSSSKVVLGGTCECEIVEWTDTRIVVSAGPISQTTYIGVLRNGVYSNGKLVTPRTVSAP
jgi:hypothetical protein